MINPNPAERRVVHLEHSSQWDVDTVAVRWRLCGGMVQFVAERGILSATKAAKSGRM